MSLWRLEWLRFTRTKRWLILGVVFAVCGAIGAPSVLLTQNLRDQVGDEIPEAFIPSATPENAYNAFLGNAQQFGLITIIIVTAGALTLRAKRETAAFLRTRVRRSLPIILPRVVISWVASILAFAVGVVIAWIGTEILVGSLAPGALAAGALLFAVYLAFVVGATALAGAIASSQLAAVLITLAIVLLLPLIAIWPAAAPWVPSELVGAPNDLLAGGSLTDHWRPALTCVLAAVAATALAVRVNDRREL